MAEQTLYSSIWRGKKFRPRTMDASSFNNWEERAFADDSSGGLGSCDWPPSSYACSFCKREFRSAQALGGHMNVHRRDRARLKQVQEDGSTTTPIATTTTTTSLLHPACSPIAVYTHNPKISFVSALPFSPAHASSMILQGNIRKRSVLPYAPEGSNLKMGKICCDDREREKQTSSDAEVRYCLEEEEEDLGGIRQGFVGDHRGYYPVEELDLELRLGDRS